MPDRPDRVISYAYQPTEGFRVFVGRDPAVQIRDAGLARMLVIDLMSGPVTLRRDDFADPIEISDPLFRYGMAGELVRLLCARVQGHG